MFSSPPRAACQETPPVDLLHRPADRGRASANPICPPSWGPTRERFVQAAPYAHHLRKILYCAKSLP